MKLRLKYQLIFYYTAIIAIIISAFLIYMLQRRGEINLGNLRNQLISYNGDVYKSYREGVPFEEIPIPDDFHFTVIDTTLSIIYMSARLDSLGHDASHLRDEVIEATLSGEGTALRFSAHSNKEYLYYARRYPEFYLRTSTPYIYENIDKVSNNYFYQYIIMALIIALFVVLVSISQKLTSPLKAFYDFFSVLKSNDKDFSKISFPNNEYGDVGRRIIDTYNQLEKAKKFKQQVTHNIAHELKTPLTGIRAYLETILEDEDMPHDTIRDFTGKAYKQTLRLSSLVNDVSMLNKLDEESEYYKIDEINISQCLNEIAEELAPKLKSNNSTFRPLISSELTIGSSYDIIYSLFKNLIDNTIEHAGPNTTITIMAGISQIAGEQSYRINFTYMDNGKGIPEKALQNLFDRFYRIEEGRTRKTGGSGLGLAIVKSSVLFHKGNITVENNPDGGVVFKFNLLSLVR